MYRWVIATLFLAALATSASAQFARRGVGWGTVAGSCPFGTSYADGCAAANQTAAVKITNFFSGYAQTNFPSGVNITHREPWNVAGVDYAVGNITPIASLVDPATAGSSNLSPYCSYFATGTNITADIQYSGSGPEVVCQNNSGADVNLHGINFGPIGGHNATFLLLSHTLTGQVNVYDNYFETDSNMNTASNGQNAGGFAQIVSGSGGTGKNIHLYNNQGNGKWLDPCCEQGPANTKFVGFFTAPNENSSGSVLAEYDATFGYPNRHYNYQTQADGHLTIRFTYMEGWNSRCPAGHGEVTDASGGELKSGVTISIASPAVVTTGTANNLSAGNPVVFSTTGALPTGITAGTTYYVIATGLSSTTFEFSTTLNGSAVNTSGSQSGTQSFYAPMSSQDYEFNTVLQPQTAGSCSTTAFYPMGVSATNYYTNITLNGNTIISGNLLATSTIQQPTVGGIVDNGTGSCPSSPGPAGNILTVCSLGTNATMGFGYSDGTELIVPFQYVSGSGVGSQWKVESSSDYGPLSVSETIPSARIWNAFYAYDQGATFNHGVVVGNPGISVTNNYLGWDENTNGAGTRRWSVNGVSSCAVAATLSGNIDLANGNAINTWDLNSGGGGC